MLRKAPLCCAVFFLLLLLLAGQWVLPGREFSELENRVLNERPAFTLDALAGSRWADRFEAFAADQLPLRDQFVSLCTSFQAVTGRRLMDGVLLGSQGRMFDRSDSYTAQNVRRNAAALEKLAEAAAVPAYLLAVPSAAAVYSEQVPARAPVADEESLLDAAARETRLIPLLPALLREKDAGDLYYHTDHHWTAKGAFIGYQAACAALSLAPLPVESSAGPLLFYGSYFARCPLPWQQPDSFTYPAISGLRLIKGEEEKAGWVDEAQLAKRDRYAALMYGNDGRMELINDGLSGGVLFVIKDSYANAILPLLARHYHRIVLIDPRYYTGIAAEEIKACQADAILCVQSVSSLAGGRSLALLRGL